MPTPGSISMRPSNTQWATKSMCVHQKSGTQRLLQGSSHIARATQDKNGHQFFEWYHQLGTQHKKPTVHSMRYKHWHKTEEVCQVEVVAQAKSQPPVTNQTPLMHLYGRHPRNHPTNSHPPSSNARQAANSQNDPRMHRTMREHNQTDASLNDLHQPKTRWPVTNRYSMCFKLNKLETRINKQHDTTSYWDEFHQQRIRQMSYQETLASSFNNTHQQIQQCQITITSFKINKSHNVIDYTNNPIIRQQSNKNMPYNQTDHANLV